jgi:Flp pilus assembly protein TadD
LAVTSRNATVHLNLGSALIAQGRMAEAAEQFTAALQIRPEYAEARNNLGFALAAQGRYAEAIAEYRLAVRAKPNGKSYFLIGNALNSQGKTDEAFPEYRHALEIDPRQPGALNDLAWILATHPESKFRNGSEAVQLAERACQATAWEEPMFLGTLAAAYAEAGRFDDAVRTGEQAHDLAERSGLKELAARNAQLVAQYREGTPYRDTPVTTPANHAP